MRNHQGLNHHYDGIITVPAKIVLSCLLVFWAISSNLVFAQNPIALEYDQIQLREDFSDKSENWPYLTTMENLYVPDKGEYFLHRRNKTNPYAIITTWKNNLAAFNILSALKLGPSDRADQTAGIIFLVQGNGKGVIAFEFNKFKQYRIKQLVGAYYKFLSGDNESEGWVKSSALAGKNDYNEIDIRVNLPQVDIYVNEKLLQSFDIMDYKAGNMGYLIGADTKAKSDYFYVYTTQEGKVKAELDSKTTKENNSAVVQLSKLRYELEQKKRSLKECELERKTAVSVLEEEMSMLRQSNERLALRNRGLQEFKDQVLVEVDEDVFLTLAENLKTEIINNQKLENQVSVYKDSLKYTHVKYSRLKLALLDKAIKKAEKEKVIREKKEVKETKEEIETELKDKKMKTEQKEWEAENPKKSVEVSNTYVAPSEPKTEPETSPTPISTKEVAEEVIEARPLPVKVRRAQKKQD